MSDKLQATPKLLKLPKKSACASQWKFYGALKLGKWRFLRGRFSWQKMHILIYLAELHEGLPLRFRAALQDHLAEIKQTRSK